MATVPLGFSACMVASGTGRLAFIVDLAAEALKFFWCGMYVTRLDLCGQMS